MPVWQADGLIGGLRPLSAQRGGIDRVGVQEVIARATAVLRTSARDYANYV